MTEFNYSIDSDGVAIISWDVPNKNMNVMSLEGLTELDKLFDQALSEAPFSHKFGTGKGPS